MLARLEGGRLADRVHPELIESTAEIATGICASVDDALRELTRAAARARRPPCEPLGLRLAAAGTHPFSLAEDQRITRRDRYRAARRAAAVRRTARARLRHAHPRRRARPRDLHEGDGGRADRAADPARAVVELAVLARRGDGARARRAPRSSPASRARGCRRASTATTTTPRPSAGSRVPARSSTTRGSGGTSGPTRGSARSRCA